jgi:hypothetical protein
MNKMSDDSASAFAVLGLNAVVWLFFAIAGKIFNPPGISKGDPLWPGIYGFIAMDLSGIGVVAMTIVIMLITFYAFNRRSAHPPDIAKSYKCPPSASPPAPPHSPTHSTDTDR